MIPSRLLLPCLTLLWSLAATTAMATPADDVIAGIDRMAAEGDKAEAALGKAIAEGVESDPAAVATALLQRLKGTGLAPQKQAVYVWALGLTREKGAIGTIIDIHRQSSSDLVKGNCLQALAEIGGKEPEAYIFAALKGTTDPSLRFNIMNLLAQMGSEALLPETEELLRQDPNQYYWQSVFVFGKLGDRAVPFLLQRIKHPDRNVRANAIIVLGQWLMAPEAAQPFLEQLESERNDELRGLLIGALERTIGSLEQVQKVFEKIAATEKNPQLATFARETLETLPALRKELGLMQAIKKAAPASFEETYTTLYKSAGRTGNFDALALYSTANDEARLKALRERILQRGSDEAFGDYQQVNDIILRNRLAR